MSSPRPLRDLARKGLAIDIYYDGSFVPCRVVRKSAAKIYAQSLDGTMSYTVGSSSLEGKGWREGAPIVIDLPEIGIASKEYRGMSEETIAFSGTVRINGKVFAHGSNNGRGGCDLWHIVGESPLMNDLLARLRAARSDLSMGDLLEFLNGWHLTRRPDGVSFRQYMHDVFDIVI